MCTISVKRVSGRLEMSQCDCCKHFVQKYGCAVYLPGTAISVSLRDTLRKILRALSRLNSCPYYPGVGELPLDGE